MDIDERLAKLSPERRRALEALVATRARADSIAVVGMSCRLPGGVDDSRTYWKLLTAGRDAVVDVPADRWDIDAYFDPTPGVVGKMISRKGGFISNVDRFDARFFGIGRREAIAMDPQQRLLLEAAWEAFEDAGHTRERREGSQTGVFIGISHVDYQALFDVERDDNPYVGAGGLALSVAAGRIAYTFDLRGPCLSIDTACSSSLVAIHQACKSLRNGESAVALAGGVNVIVAPTVSIAFSRAGLLSPNGRCAAFSAGADGYVRSEGLGLVVLKRYEDALAAGDRILGLVRGSAVNQDGLTNGLTAPNPLAQSDAVRRACREAGIEPSRLQYVEAHGTGTALGDPIEIRGLSTAIGTVAGHRCALGSVKTNIGHAESAAGVAGFLKTLLALQHRQIPPSLHFDQPNPLIPFAEAPLEVQTALGPWPSADTELFAGISSFGFSGTNAHVVVSEAPPPEPGAPADLSGGHLLPISASSAEALDAYAARYAEFLDATIGDEESCADVCFTAATRRTHLPHRLVVQGRTRADLVAALRAPKDERFAKYVVSSVAAGPPAKIAFVFAGQGAQWQGMGRALLRTSPVFRTAIEEWDAELRKHDFRLLDALLAEPENSGLDRIDAFQPSFVAIGAGLAAVLSSWGVEPGVVVGHSLGEVTAAYVAGALDLSSAARVVVARSRLIQEIVGRGEMSIVDLSASETEEVLADFEGRLSIAAINSPSKTLVSGDHDAMASLFGLLQARDVFCRRVTGNFASHSAQVDGLLPRLTERLAGIVPLPGRVPFLSTVTGDVVPGQRLDASYWAANVRRPVKFIDAIRRTATSQRTIFLELSTHPVLGNAINETIEDLGALAKGSRALPSLRREEEEPIALARVFGALHVGGAAVDWSKRWAERRAVAELPNYPWQRERFWPTPLGRLERAPGKSEAHDADETPIDAPKVEPARSAATLLDGVPHEDRLEVLLAELRRRAATQLGVPVESLSADAPLVGAGFDSIMLIELRNKALGDFKVDVNLASMFRGNLRDLARAFLAAIDRTSGGEAGPADAAEAIPTVLRGVPLQVSSAQGRLLVLEQLEPGSGRYNIPAALLLEGELDVAALDGALATLVLRHESLRTSFSFDEGEALQIVHPASPTQLLVRDWKGSDGDLERVIREEAEKPFDLRNGPLYRASLLRIERSRHVLLFTMHHVVSDGWSIGVLVRELGVLYRAGRRGEAIELPPLRVQYADYAAWQRTRLSGSVLQRDLEHWKKELDGIPAALDLPTERARPAIQTSRGRTHRSRLSAELRHDVHQFARQRDLTPFVVLLSTFHTLLARLSGTSDIVIGSPVANRTRPELEGLIGFFVNTLPIRATIDLGESFDVLLERVGKATFAAFAHAELPFERLVEAINPARDMSRTPVFQVVFVLQSAENWTLRLDDLTLSMLPSDSGTAKYDLSLELIDGVDGIATHWEYNTDLFDDATIARWSRHYQTLLRSLLVRPEAPLDRAPLLTAEERQAILRTFAAPDEEPTAKGLLHSQFEAHSDRTPNAIAVADEDQSLTYAELEARANRLAHHLVDLGARGDEPVALLLDRSVDMLVAILGVLKAGAAYLPLDPVSPPDRLLFTLNDARVRILVTHRSLSPPQAVHLDAMVHLDRDADTLARRPSARLAKPLPLDTLAYVIYTSGSTGKPKGTLISHRNVASLLLAAESEFQFGSDDVWTLFHSYAFDFSVWEIWGALAYGGRLVVVPYLVSRSPDAFLQLLARERVTVLNQTPSAFRQLMRADEEHPQTLSLRWVVFGGEALELRSLQPWFERHGDARPTLVNMYGITETTVHVTFRRLSAEDALASASLIGKPLRGVTAYLLDAHGEPLPEGVTGELFVGGFGLARGYLQRPELSAERFLPDPFGKAGGRLYRTGDLARLRGGQLDYLGRIDHQVKIRGFRIELGEIETALLTHSTLREVAVLARPDASGDKRLVAYVVLGDKEHRPLVSELREHLLRSLPDHMVPSAFVFLDALPLTQNGKLDRNALFAADVATPSDRDYVAPESELEETLADVFAELLGHPFVGALDNFFELGGHSLLATRLVSRIRRDLDRELPLRTVFEAPTVRGIANALAGRGASALEPAIVRVPRTEPIPLSFGQERLWLLDQIDRNSATYNMPAAFRLRGPVDVEALGRSFDELVRRHEVLRTTFESRDDRDVQQICPPPKNVLAIEDASASDDRALLERASREAVLPFDLRTGPLFRATLLRRTSEDHVLLVTMHHVVSDGWSIGILVKEIVTAYGAFLRNQPSPLPELAIQYADYAAWQRAVFSGKRFDDLLGFWRDALRALPAIELPLDRPRPATLTYDGKHLPFALGDDLAKRVRAFAQAEGVTPYVVLLAAFHAFLGRISGQNDFATGSPIANRSRHEVEGLIGFFVNTLVFRAQLAGTDSFRELVAATKVHVLAAFAHQDAPFEAVVSAVQPPRDTSRSPLFQALFALQNTPNPSFSMDALRVEPLPVDNTVAKFELSLDLTDDETFAGHWEYNTDLFDDTTIARWANHFQTLLRSLLERPEARFGRAAILSGEERRSILHEFNPPNAPFTERDATIPDVFERIAARSPNDTALVLGDDALSYGELAARANRLAHFLVERGVRAGDAIALSFPRSFELLVAMLAILKAGGAYVPLDPKYPDERIAFMLHEANVRLVLAHRHAVPSLPADVTLLLPEELDLRPLPASAPVVPVGPLHAAYVLYTSGSTGKPKAVAIPHRGVLRLVHGDFATFASNRTFLLLAPLTFDASTFEIWGALLHGAALAIYPPELPSLDGLAHVLRKHSVSTLWLTAGLFHQIVDNDLDALASVSELLAGGDVLSPTHVKKLVSTLPNTRLIDGYGPTENTTFTTTFAVPAEAHLVPAPIPIGKPLPYTSVFVLDSEFEPVPIGVTGELFTGGDGLALGYLGRPELSAEKFVPHPFAERPGQRLYRTGDLARFRADGNIEFLGRIDNQVKIRGFRIELGEIEIALRSHSALREAVVLARADRSGAKRLVAYLIPRDREPRASVADLREHLLRSLPEHMVPSAFVFLDALPLTQNGKLDRNALPAPAEENLELDREYAPPATPAEQVIAEVWSSLLGYDRIGVHDNFFELGGDSILGIQVVARAAQRGLHLTPKSVFENQTIRALARVARTSTGAVAAQGPVTGPVILGPVQRWFFDQQLRAPNHFNQSIVLETTIAPEILRRAIGALVAHHDALRFRIAGNGAELTAGHAEVEEVDLLEEVDLSHLDGDTNSAYLEHAERLQRSLDIEHGPILRALLARRGGELPSVLLFAIHHLAVDGVSWRILLEDLDLYCAALQRGAKGALPAKTSSFQAWTARLKESVDSGRFAGDADYWRAIPVEVAALPVDGTADGADTHGASRTVQVALGVEDTRALLQSSLGAYRLQVNDLLLTALALALREWTERDAHWIDLEGHGREPLFDDIDLSRTIGWFTAIYPVRLALPAKGMLGDAIKAIKETLREVPSRGVGFGVLRYLGTDPSSVADVPRPDLVFNYLGQLDGTLGESSRFRAAGVSTGAQHGLENRRSHPLEVTASVFEGKLSVRWGFDEGRHAAATIERLGRRFVELLAELGAHCRSTEAGGLTVSDFPLVHLGQRDLDRIAHADPERGRGIENVLPLTPLQGGMLFHTLYEQSSGSYVVQTTCTLRGPFELAAFERAWSDLVARHEILRTSFRSDTGGAPVQVIHRHARARVYSEDVRRLGPADQDEHTLALLQTIRRRGFVLGEAPLARVDVLRREDEAFTCALSFHHILLDGWSLPLIYRDLFTLYRSARSGEAAGLPPTGSFALYLQWRESQTKHAEAMFWRGRLRGFETPTPIGFGTKRDAPPRHREIVHTVSEATTKALQVFARRNQLTMNTALQGAWALLLARYGDLDDVVFGATMSGRSAPIAGIETLVGLLINTLPVRVRIPADRTVAEWLSELQADQSALRSYEHTPLVEVQALSDLPPGVSLFESLVVFENYPIGEALGAIDVDLRIENVIAEEQTNYPLTLIAFVQGTLTIRALHDAARFDEPDLRRALVHLENLLSGFARLPNETPAAVSMLSSGESASLSKEWSALPDEQRRLGFVARSFGDPRQLELVPRGGTGRLFVPVDESVPRKDEVFALGDIVVRETTARARVRLDGAIERLDQPATLRPTISEHRVVVSATFTAEPIEDALAHWLSALDFSAEIRFAPYNQIFQQLADPTSAIRTNRSGLDVLLVRLEDWAGRNDDDVERNTRELVAALTTTSFQVPLLLVICPHSRSSAANRLELLRRCEGLLLAELDAIPGVQAVGTETLAALYPVVDYEDTWANELGHVPYTEEQFAAFATLVSRRFHALHSPPFKVVVVDADNTLWKGVLGEDGADGVRFDPPFLALQQRLVDEHDAGMLVCVCSKNDERDVRALFEKRRDEMPLKAEHIVAWRVNWNAKSSNIQTLATQLDLGLDAFVFLDDNPVECAEVASACPEVLVVQVPNVADEIVPMLSRLWALDHARTSSEDRQRTELYRQNVAREELREKAPSLEQFLAGLELVVETTPLASADVNRASQLTHRTNQFNLSGRRRSEAEMRALLDPTSETKALVTRVRDRFGDYGLVGLAIITPTADTLVTDTFLLSCRVLGRGVEHQILATIAAIALDRELAAVDLLFVESARNAPAKEFADSVAKQLDGSFSGNAYRFSAARAQRVEVRFEAREDSPHEAVKARAAAYSAPRRATLERLRHELHSPREVLEWVKRRRLRRLDSSSYVAATTATEVRLASIWSEVLGLTKVGIRDNFFALGGHSLLATQMASRIERTFGVALPLRVLFENPTVEALARAIENGITFSGPPLSKRNEDEPLHLSFAQERLWFLTRLDPTDTTYNMVAALRISGPVDLPLLQRAFDALVERHESLRTTFATQPDFTAVQVVTAARPIVLDIRSARTEDLATEVAADASTTFDLTSGPLLRVRILRFADEDHALLFGMHHIVSDGWSMSVLVRELLALYGAFGGGLGSPLAPLPIQYPDFALWQRAWLKDAALEALLKFWKDQLHGVAPLELPLDRPRPPIRVADGDRVVFALGEANAARVRELALAEGVTPFMLLLAAFQTFLGRLSGQANFATGSPIANRARPELESLIGFFVNTLVFRANLVPTASFRELLAATKETALAAYAHQDAPFEAVVAAVEPARDMSRTPLFQAMFILQNTPPTTLSTAGLEFSPIEVQTQSAKFDLTLEVVDDEALSASFEYATSLFDRSTVERWAGHFQRLVGAFLDAPDQPLARAELLSPEERGHLLSDFNDTEVVFPERDLPLHQLFARQVARTPDAAALVFEGESISYSQLLTRVRRLAHHLRTDGVRPGDLVAVCLERSFDLVVALFAILEAGAAYVPLDPSYPADRLRFMLEDSGARRVLSHSALARLLPESDPTVIALDRLDIASCSSAPLDVAVTSRHRAYVIYTSGSTGRPKGAANSHGAVVNRLFWAQRALPLERSDTFVQKTPFSFDVSVCELFWPLLVGAKLVLARPEGHKDPAYLAQLFREQDVTNAHFVPSMLRAFLELTPDLSALPLRRVLCSGEALPAELAAAFLSRSSAELHNLYGPTEAAVDVSWFHCLPDRVGHAVVPIGKPIANTSLLVLDHDLNPVPLGVAGELFIGGVQLADGYLGRPELTAEKFVPDPFSAEPGARLYRTGDLTRLRSDGNIDFLGRLDHQVKVRGFRIELGEIETALLALTTLRDAVVVAKDDRLVAYVVPRDAAPSTLELRDQLLRSLPEHMVPNIFVSLAALPLNPNGKLDRNALPAFDPTTASERTFVAPSSPTEVALAEVFAEVLKIPRVGVDDNFFELGGHSLLATQVVARAERTLPRMNLRALFTHPTVRQLAVHLAETVATDSDDATRGASAIGRVEREAVSIEDVSESKTTRKKPRRRT